MGRTQSTNSEERHGTALAQHLRTRAVVLCLLVALLGACLVNWTTRKTHSVRSHDHEQPRTRSPAEEFADNVVPFREQEPWDISVDFPYPRKLSYEVSEGTWMSLDVHPQSGEIIFDLLGDLYCLTVGSKAARAVTRGIPHDVQPRFSPDGHRLAFRSDAGQGVDNIWVMPWRGCDAMALLQGEYLDLKLVRPETRGQRRTRLLLEGRAEAFRVTNETYRFLSDPRWHPSGDRVIATKFYTSQSTVAAGEGWEYQVPRKEERVAVGAGKRIVERNLPLGWPASMYNFNPIGPVQFLWAGKNKLIYSLNVMDDNGLYQDSKDVHSGVNAIFQKDLATGRTTKLVDATPGGASRPELSRDGRTLAFVRRVRDREALVLMDLQSGSLRNVWYGLTWDISAGAAPSGSYPGFAFTPSDDAVVIWAAGQLWRVPLALNSHGERTSGSEPSIIPFLARVEKRIAETLRPNLGQRVREIETASRQQVHAFKGLDVDATGRHVVFSAEGTTYLADLKEAGLPFPVPVRQPELAYYSPSFSASSDAIVHVRWSNSNLSTIEIASLTSPTVVEVAGLPWAVGRYYAPALCPCGKHLAFARLPGDYASGMIVANAGTGVYVATLEREASQGILIATNVQRVTDDDFPVGGDMPYAVALRLYFLTDSCTYVVVRNQNSVFYIDVEAAVQPTFSDFQQPLQANIRYSQSIIATGHISEEIMPSPDGRFAGFVERMQVYVAPLDAVGKSSTGAYARPANATEGLIRVSESGGHDIAFSRDGRFMFWLSGPHVNRLQLNNLKGCKSAAEADIYTFGVDCVTKIADKIELKVEFDADTLRLKREAFATEPNNDNADILVLTNATIVTMRHGNEEEDVVRRGAVMVRDSKILFAGNMGELEVPPGAHVIDVNGGHIVPGFIDSHGHMGRTFTFPVANWQYAAHLAYGVTTFFNPSHAAVGGFFERFLLESPKGRSLGPRIFQTGEPLFGSEGWPMLHQEAADMREARDALARIRAEGGHAGIAYKNYQLPVRASRQRLLLEGRNTSMLCVPEGGWNFHWMLTYMIDGMTSIEHAMVPPVIYDDVLTLWAESGTSTTPTMIVSYGGVFGEEHIWATRNVAEDKKIRRFVPHVLLEQHQESTARPWYSYSHHNISRTTAELIRRGTLANIGAHGETPMGLNYHSELRFFLGGGLTPYEVLRSATRMPAQHLGLFDAIGSLEVGKLADLVVYPPEVDILANLDRSEDILYVVRGGRVRLGETLEEVWPVKGRKLDLPVLNADD